MELFGAGDALDVGYVRGAYARPGHNDYASVGLSDEFGYELGALLGRGLLSRGEQAVATQVYDLLQSAAGRSAHVECAVEGHRHLSRGIYHAAAHLHIYIALGGQRADHHAVHSRLAAVGYVAAHDLRLLGRIEEIAFARADYDINVEAEICLGRHVDERAARGDASAGDGGAQLYSYGASRLGFAGFGER